MATALVCTFHAFPSLPSSPDSYKPRCHSLVSLPGCHAATCHKTPDGRIAFPPFPIQETSHTSQAGRRLPSINQKLDI